MGIVYIREVISIRRAEMLLLDLGKVIIFWLRQTRQLRYESKTNLFVANTTTR